MSVTYYPIDEETARRAWECVHMGDYKTGSATEIYRASVDEAAALVEHKKKHVSPFYHEKLDALLYFYARRLAEWQNAYNRNEASCPSVFIAGASNFPVHKKEKQNAREDKLWSEYDAIKAILDKIKSVGSGAVDLADPHAREILTDDLTKYQNRLEYMKSINAYYRTHHTHKGYPDMSDEIAAERDTLMQEAQKSCPWITSPYPDYELTSTRSKIKRLQERLDELDKRAAQSAEGGAENTEFSGGEIVRNLEQDRLQIIFDDKPDEEMRSKLKSNGFRWSPRNQAWQRQLTDNAEHAARHVLGID